MAKIKYLSIDKDRIPYRFAIRLAGETFVFETHYNTEGDFFTVDLCKGEQLLCTDKFVYGRHLFPQLIDVGRFPRVYIVPLDVSDTETVITWENFMKSVKPYIFTPEDLEISFVEAVV